MVQLMGYLSMIALILCMFVSNSAQGAAADDEIAVVRDRLVADLAKDAPDDAWALQQIQSLRPDGSWPDIDYKSQVRSRWPTAQHMHRTVDLAAVYANPDRKLAGNDQLGEAVTRSLNYWLENDFICPNWWANEIDVPRNTGRILLLMGDNLPEALRRGMIDTVLSRSRIARRGQNRVWLSQNVLMRGLLTNNADLVAKAARSIFGRIKITLREGVQPDSSFHQHGPQQQFGNYGRAFIETTTRWGLICDGTSLGLSDTQLAVLRHYCLDGLRWVVWRGRLDVIALGRHMLPQVQREKAAAIAVAFERMAKLDPDHARAYATLSDQLPPDNPKASLKPVEFTGNRFFWRSENLVHRRARYCLSVKMCSDRTQGQEMVNGANRLGARTADGATYLVRRGDEYAGTFAVWDWHCVPGATAPKTGKLPEFNIRGYPNPASFVGGVSDGELGAAVLVLNRKETHARKAWFCFDNVIACLGTDIRADTDHAIATTLDQRALRGPVSWRSDGQIRSVDQTADTTLEHPDWVHHDGIGYVPLEACNLELAAAQRTGSWQRVADNLSDDPVTESIMTLILNHGKRSDGASYAYALVPDVSPESLGNGRDDLDIKVLVNTAECQAVQQPRTGVMQAVFYEAGEIQLNSATILRVDQPCIILAQPKENDWRVSVADPTHKQKSLRLHLNATVFDIDLPTDGKAGATVTRTLTADR